MNDWRRIKVTIVVEVEGEQPIQLTETHKDIHISESHGCIMDMANAFRIYADEREREKPYNSKWMPMVSKIKRVPYSQWAGIDMEDREVVLSRKNGS